MTTDYDTVAARLQAAGYSPDVAADRAAIQYRLAGKVGSEVVTAQGLMTVVAVDPVAIEATFASVDRTFDVDAAALGPLFGAAE